MARSVLTAAACHRAERFAAPAENAVAQSWRNSTPGRRQRSCQRVARSAAPADSFFAGDEWYGREYTDYSGLPESSEVCGSCRQRCSPVMPGLSTRKTPDHLPYDGGHFTWRTMP